ncbi:hypothetical protein [Photorhabdus sp. RM71S]|uniref:hypothetical protein n=1 Tax=Photorhabdus sp. RM71S TaxID=3342824 RepID=UPI0036DBB40B
MRTLALIITRIELSGSQGTLIQYWKFTDTIPKLDEKGKPVLDDTQYASIELMPLMIW